MTPQDKAKKLFQLFGTAIAERVDEDGFVCNTEQAKQCALLAVDEVLKECSWELTGFWMSVKQEIENL
jgi:hypothetical protein